MCTVIVALGTSPVWPVVVAANRDERLSRAAAGWERWAPSAGPAFLAPKDLEAGGTWMGLSAAGVLAAVTNRYTGAPPDRALRSRGELVGLALRHPSAAAARAALQDQPASRWNPFHLVVVDRAGGWVWAPVDGVMHFRELGAGLHVITEQSADGTDPRSTLIRARWSAPTREAMAALLGIHGDTPLDSTCVHLGERYGTRSSAWVGLGKDTQLWTADVRPCAGSLEDRTALLRLLA